MVIDVTTGVLNLLRHGVIFTPSDQLVGCLLTNEASLFKLYGSLKMLLTYCVKFSQQRV
jgi:hypothetical protein